MSKNFIEKLNLNKYQWWRILTFALLIFLFTSYNRAPQLKLFNAKDICGKWWMGQIKKEDAFKKLKLEEKGDLLDYCVHFR
jgi:hypothetical protein|tara:strand:- start:1 stop:243 length:243 start_codon:yes stop_codon:yes gene_type:complete